MLYAAATSSDLTELLQDWAPEQERRDMQTHVPGLARAIIELVNLESVDVFQTAAGTDDVYGTVGVWVEI